jgi:hypothetical protein
MDAAAAAFLIELGVGDRIIGTSGTDIIAGDVRTHLDAIPVLDQRAANREQVIAEKPDLVTGISVYELGSFDGTPTPQQLRDNGITPPDGHVGRPVRRASPQNTRPRRGPRLPPCLCLLEFGEASAHGTSARGDSVPADL